MVEPMVAWCVVSLVMDVKHRSVAVLLSANETAFREVCSSYNKRYADRMNT